MRPNARYVLVFHGDRDDVLLKVPVAALRPTTSDLAPTKLTEAAIADLVATLSGWENS
ncbi:MAG: hypothetical protein GXP62_00805 [Oligoflexia bacterium]|nr:hypothetical protein [Oligoflexia bacterium]